MSNISTYKELMAFHPGYYIAEILEDMGITQAEFAMRMGTTPKTLSLLLNGQASLSNDLAEKLSLMLGNSVDFWLNLQKAYDEQIIEIQKAQEIDKQIPIMELIDYSYFVRIAKLPQVRSASEKITNLCSYLKVSNLFTFKNPDFLVNFRTAISKSKEKNTLNARIWLQVALNFAQDKSSQQFNAPKLKEYLPEIRTMTLRTPEFFLPRLIAIFAECGVIFVLVPYLKNSGINGAVKWVNPNRVILAMNDRMLNADTFWFSLFHEIKHILQQKLKTVFVISTMEDMNALDSQLEQEADTFAQNMLIPPKDYMEFAPSKYTSDAEILSFAKRIGIHPGVVAGRLQHEHIIAPSRCSKMKEKYKIIMNE